MTRQDLLEEIAQLPIAERIELVGDIWDTVAASPTDVRTPDWHLEELEKRLADGSPRYLPWNEVRARLREAD